MSESIYERYCKLRDLAGYKDSDVAKGAKITKSTFSDWKSGRYVPKQEKLQKVADFLQVSINYLMKGSESAEENRSSQDDKEKRLMGYARKLLDLGLEPDDLESLIDIVEKMQKKE